MNSLNTAATGMSAQQLNVEVISNNIANMNTTGFKRHRAEFSDLMYASHERVGRPTGDNVKPVGVDVGMGVKAVGVSSINTQGALSQTGNELDVAIDGRGYLTVAMPDGSQAYTRAGALQMNAEGMLVTQEGYEVDPGIAIPDDTTKVEINKEGVVYAFFGLGGESVEVGQLTLATFANQAGLRNIGSNLLVETPASGAAVTGNPGDEGFGSLQQGYVEASNVEVITEITALIGAQRAYEMNSKVVQTADDMMQTSSNIR